MGQIFSSIGSAVTGGLAGAGSIVASTIGGALVGAATGAIVTAVRGGDVGKGAIIGAVTGGVVGGVSSAAQGAGFLSSNEFNTQPSYSSGATRRAAGTDAALQGSTMPTQNMPVANQGLSFRQQMLLEGVKGGAGAGLTALLDNSDDIGKDDMEVARERNEANIEIAKIQNPRNEIPKMKSYDEVQASMDAQPSRPVEQKASVAPEPARRQVQTPADQMDTEILNLRQMVAELSPQNHRGLLSVGSFDIRPEVA